MKFLCFVAWCIFSCFHQCTIDDYEIVIALKWLHNNSMCRRVHTRSYICTHTNIRTCCTLAIFHILETSIQTHAATFFLVYTFTRAMQLNGSLDELLVGRVCRCEWMWIKISMAVAVLVFSCSNHKTIDWKFSVNKFWLQ